MASFNIYCISNLYYNIYIIARIIDISSYVLKFMAYDVQAFHNIVHVYKACLPVPLTLLCS